MSDATDPFPADHAPSDPLWRFFDPEWYAAAYPEAAGEAGGAEPDRLEHFYWEQGCRRGHSPNRYFDEAGYLAAYPDVAAHVAAGGARCGFEHYLQDGYRDRAAHWLFDEGFYCHRVRSAADAPGVRNGYDHFLRIGDRDGLSGHAFFDPAVARDHGLRAEIDENGEEGGLFAAFLGDPGAGDRRLSWYFDPVWYLATYPEVRAEIEAGRWTSALHHYLCNPDPLRFEPNAFFSEAFYRDTYADVSRALASGGFRNGYTHFLRHGAAERRRPHPDVDLDRHFARLGIRQALRRGGFADAFAHYVAEQDALTEPPPPATEAQCKRVWVRQAEIAATQFARTPLDFTVSGEPELSVVMVVHDRFALTLTALASLRAGFRGALELVLVDSGSRDETATIERFVSGAVVLRFERNLGFVAGCNAGLDRASAPVVLFLNNDLTLGMNAVPAGLARLRADPTIGAVGGRIVRTTGELQEAGCIIWRDGWTSGYLRGADPDLPEANFVREVDFCSGAFLMAPRALLRDLGGFDPAFRPAYHEEVDLCVRIRRLGRRVVYDPAILVQHLEFGSSSPERSARLIARNHRAFVEKHRDWLRFQYPSRSGRSTVFARSPRGPQPRILFFEDRVPQRALGSGYVRSNDIVRAMAALGYEVGVYPVYPSETAAIELLRDFPDTVELFHDRGLERLPDFLDERAGYYDLVWIGRTHNLGRLLPVLEASAAALPDHGFILDTEAVAAPRERARARLLGRDTVEQPLDTLLREELASAYFCQKIVAVNAFDAQLIRRLGHRDVSVLGHALPVAVGPVPSWDERAGLLFLGAFHTEDSPNFDSMAWFVSEVLPRLGALLPSDATLTIAGHVDADRVDLCPLAADPRVRLVGAVDRVGPLFDRHRVFVAPTRFAGGIPFKVHEAAAHGLPVVASQLLVDQVGWQDGTEILSGGDNDPDRFAAAVAQLYHDAALWRQLSEAGLARIRREHDPDSYRDALAAILQDVRDGADPRRGLS